MRFGKKRLRRVLTKTRRVLDKTMDGLVVPLLPRKYANLLQSSKVGLWDSYFVTAETGMQEQWDGIIWPLIRDFDFDAVLELAPGAGRNTEKLCAISKKVYAVDYNSYALEQCKERLGAAHRGCGIEYHTNDGESLEMIGDGAISAIYCWDAAVHFDRSILRGYTREFSRVLRTAGRGFVHHSNLGETANKNIKKNPHWRSNVSKQSFAEMCEANGLRVVAQVDIPWGSIVDCGTVFEKIGPKRA